LSRGLAAVELEMEQSLLALAVTRCWSSDDEDVGDCAKDDGASRVIHIYSGFLPQRTIRLLQLAESRREIAGRFRCVKLCGARSADPRKRVFCGDAKRLGANIANGLLSDDLSTRPIGQTY